MVSDDIRAQMALAGDDDEAAEQLPQLTLAGRDALRRRNMAALLEMQSVIFETHGLMPGRDVDKLPDMARTIIADLACVAHRTREMIGGQQ